MKKSLAVVIGLPALLGALAGAAYADTLTLQYGVGGYTGETDTYIVSSSQNQNNGTQGVFQCVPTTQKSLIKFALTSVPSGAIVDSATLQAYIFSNSGGGSNQVFANRVLKAWTETGATWKKYSASQNWSTAGLGAGTDYVAAVSAIATLTSTSPENEWANFDVTALVRDWLSGAVPNHGLLLTTTGGLRPQFYSAQSGGPLVPKLTIVYHLTPDITPPTTPAGLTATPVSQTQINLAWSAATDNVGVVGYRVYRGGVQIASVSGLAYSNTGLVAQTTYSYQVSALDAAGNESARSSTVAATTLAPPPPDTTPPSVPANLVAAAASSTKINLSWSAATDNVGVSGYKVYRDGTLTVSVSGLSYADTGLTPQTSYAYEVSALDAAGNESARSSTATATTPPTPTTTGFVFTVYGDSRAGSSCSDNTMHMQLVNLMVSDNPALVFHVGDMITGYNSNTNWARNGSCSNGSLRDIIAPLTQRPPPPGLPMTYYPVVGNHDDGWGDRWYPDAFGDGFCSVWDPHLFIPNHTTKPYFIGHGATVYTDAQFYTLAASTTSSDVYANYFYYSFDYQNCHFAVMHVNNDNFNLIQCNSCGADQTNYDDYYNIHQRDWLVADLTAAAANPAINHIFVFQHAPNFTTADDHPATASAPILTKVFSDHKVELSFAGHNHVYERSVPIRVDAAHPSGVRDDVNGTIYVTTGGGGSPLAGFGSHPTAWWDAARFENYHYTRVTVDGTSISIEAVDQNGAVVDSFTR